MKRIVTTAVFDTWLMGLKDDVAAGQIQSRIERAANGNFGDHAVIGGGISEMRIHIGPGYRVYFTLQGKEIVILLAGGIKSSQPRDIKQARQLLRTLRGIA